MVKYLLKRILHGLVSVAIVVAIVMVLIYGLLNRQQIFKTDQTYVKMSNNAQVEYRYRRWQDYGYLDYVTYAQFIDQKVKDGEISPENRDALASFGRKPENDSPEVAELVKEFTETYEKQGYTVERLNAKMSKRKLAKGGQQQLFAYRDHPLYNRLLSYFGGLFSIDSIHYVPAENDIGERGLTFTLYDPVYGGEKFSPAIIGNGTKHKYLLYCDSSFPYIHQNFFNINLGKSYSIQTGVDVAQMLTTSQGSYVTSPVLYPTGHEEVSADDLHSATYQAGSLESSDMLKDRFTDDYTTVITVKKGMSKMGFSFVIGILATCMSYLLGVPLGIIMARHKDSLIDKLGTVYIVFIIAVPSLAYIFLFKAIGGSLGLPTTFDVDSRSKLMYILPIISLALPAVANLMKWLRRYMIDQMNSDYVKFARSGGLSENEIFFKHIAKNAAIPIIHGIPGSVLFAMTGAIITERVYTVPGCGDLLTRAIGAYDNGVIIGMVMFYAILSVVSIILGDILMSVVDPRISFTSEGR